MSRIAVLVALGLLASCGGGCKKAVTAPPVEGLRPADDARAQLVATVTLAPPAGTLAKVDALAAKLQLPFSGKDLATSIAAGNNLPDDALAQLDPGRSIGIALVARGRDAPPLEAIAATARSPQAAEKLVAGLGTTVEQQKGARKLQRPGGTTLWVTMRGGGLLASSSLEGLQTAGALALEAQQPAPDDAVVRLFPDALARSQGTDVKTALANFRKEAVEQQMAQAEARGGPVPSPAERLTLEAALDAVLEPVGETTVAAVSLSLDAARGVSFGLRMHPRPRSAFAARVARKAPYALDPAVLATGVEPIAFAVAVGESSFWLDAYERLLAAQSQGGLDGAADVVQRWRTLRPQLTGAVSGTTRLTKAGFAYDFVMPARSAPAALDAVAALVTAPGFAQLLGALYGKAAPRVHARREDAGVRAELAFPVRDRPGDPGTMVKALLGTPTLSALFAAGGGRLVAATEPGARTRVAALARGGTGSPPPELAAALAETRGADGLVYVDLWATARPIIPLVVDPQQARLFGAATMLPGLDQLRLPLVISYRGGATLDGEMRVPMATLTSAASWLRPLLGMAGGVK